MQPQPEKIESQQETATSHPSSHGETPKDNDNHHQTQIQDNKTMNNTQELLGTKTGVDIWVLNLQISRQTSSLTGAQDAETSVY